VARPGTKKSARGGRFVRLAVLVVLVLFGVSLFTDSARRSGQAAPPRFEYRRAVGFGENGMVRFPDWTTVLGLYPADGATLVHLARLDLLGVQTDSAVAKVRGDGTLDPSFAVGGATPGILQLGGPSVSLFPQRDGRFIVGINRFRSDGSLEAAAPGLVPGANPVTYFETGAGLLVSVQDSSIGAYGCQLNHHAADGVPGVTIGINQRCQRAIAISDGGGATLLMQRPDGGMHLVFVGEDGLLDTSRGGTGIVEVETAGSAGWLVDLAWQSGKLLALLSEPGASETAVLARIGRDGQLDESFGSQGLARVSGSPRSFDVGADSITVHLAASTTIRQNSPYHPTLVSLRPDGGINTSANPYGIVPGWWDVVEADVSEFVLGAAHLPLGYGRTLLAFGPYARPGEGVRLLAIDPVSVRIFEVESPANPLRPAERVSPPPQP
jgi:hypothetical protein